MVITPEVNYEMQKEIFRFAAMLFSGDDDVFSSTDSQLQMIKCIFVEKGNSYLTFHEITNELHEMYKYHITKDELFFILKNNSKTFEVSKVNDEDVYRLNEEKYIETNELQKKNIDFYIEQFIELNNYDNPEKCKHAIHRYLYELLTTNINSYKILIYGKDDTKFSDSELSVDISCLDQEETKVVHDFLDWDSYPKNIALSNIVFACLEYCMLVNGDKPAKLLVNSIRKRRIYLDTNIIFRALGINGESRRRVVISFLNKCKQAKVKMVISHSTDKEFTSTIEYYMSQILAYPRGKIYWGAFQKISDYSLFSFYEDWQSTRPKLSLNYFKMHIQSLYKKLIKDFGIVYNEQIDDDMYRNNEFQEKIRNYSLDIKNKKREKRVIYDSDDSNYSLNNQHDATVISYIEHLRESAKDNEDIFFVSSDKVLRYWDMDRKSGDYPVVIYPSQLFLALIKMCGRSDDDFSTFVSFINVRSSNHQMTPEKANIVLAGISSITEDLTSQELLISAICENEFQDVIKSSAADEAFYNKVKEYSQNFLREELNEHKEAIDMLTGVVQNQDERITSLEGLLHESEKVIALKTEEIDSGKNDTEKQKQKICSFAEKRIFFKFITKIYIFPIAVSLILLTFIVFVALQFLFCDESWNFSVRFFQFIANTPFGKNTGAYMVIINGVLATPIFFFTRAIWNMKPWNEDERLKERQKMVERYIEKNKLM